MLGHPHSIAVTVSGPDVPAYRSIGFPRRYPLGTTSADSLGRIMMPADVDLIASYWTIAGDIDVLGDAISPWAFEERVTEAATAGYVGFGLTHVELQHLEATQGFGTMRSIFEEHGITIVELEALTDWFADGEDREHSDRVRRDLLRASDALAARHIKVVGTLADDQEDVGSDRMIESFAQLCADAAEVGTAVVIEMLPIGNVSSLDAAMHLVQGAAAPNGGILLDMWHVHRTGTPLEAVAELPAGVLKHVELDDGGPPAPGSAFEDTIRNRKLCGEGEFDIAGFYRATRAAGYSGAYGVEILSTTFRTRDLVEMATRSFDTASAVISSVD